MSKYKRINLAITDLSPESASKVFGFLNDCLSNRLSIEYYKKKILDYSINEQYFILYYAKIYFSESDNSYLSMYIQNTDRGFADGEKTKEITNHFDNLRRNGNTLLAYLSQIENTLERQYKKRKKNNIHLTSDNSVYNYRVPLYFNTNNKSSNILKIDKETFKKESQKIICRVMDYVQFEKFFINSFEYQGNLEPIQLLHVEMGNVKQVYSQFYKLYTYYKTERNHQNKIVSDIRNELINGEIKRKDNLPVNSLRRKFIKIPPKVSLKKITRFDVMKIMYNTFPQIREGYSQYQSKNPLSTLDSYLEIASRNIKNA